MVNFQDQNELLIEVTNKRCNLYNVLLGVHEESKLQCLEYEQKSKVSKRSFEYFF